MTTMAAEPKPLPPHIADDYARWQAKRASQPDGDTAPADFDAVKRQLLELFDKAPERVEIPYHLTPEGERWAKFKAACDPEFHPKIDYARVKNRHAFDLVANWSGKFPGPCATGPSGTGKTRAAWWALRQLWVKQGIGFSWWPVRKLIQNIEDCGGSLEGLMYRHQASRIFFVDDADKLNWQYESHAEALFAFYDFVYRQNFPCITTTNKDRQWWVTKMGEAFTRRLMDGACFEVSFMQAKPGKGEKSF